jgi:hypothetical protein
MDSLAAQIGGTFKATYGLKITDSADMFLAQRNLLESLMKLGVGVMRKVFEDMKKGYGGAVTRKEGRKYKFVGYRTTSLHGLFGGPARGGDLPGVRGQAGSGPGECDQRCDGGVGGCDEASRERPRAAKR